MTSNANRAGATVLMVLGILGFVASLFAEATLLLVSIVASSLPWRPQVVSLQWAWIFGGMAIAGLVMFFYGLWQRARP